MDLLPISEADAAAMEAEGETAPDERDNREFLPNETAGAVRRCGQQNARFARQTSPRPLQLGWLTPQRAVLRAGDIDSPSDSHGAVRR